MKTLKNLLKYSLMLLAFVAFTGCSSDDEDTPAETVSLQLSGEGVENAGSNQYEYDVETGEQVNVTVNVESTGTLEALEITKTVNNEVDESFGTNGTMTVNASGSNLTHNFNYTAVEDDVDQLVNFTFEAITTTGVSDFADLTVAVTLSPLDNLSRRRWSMTSVYWVNGEEEGIKECEKDNSWILHEDGTMTVDYGEDTGEGECSFDGFTDWTDWEITEENDVMTFTRYGTQIFSGEDRVETYVVEELTTEELVLSIVLDMTDFGETAEEQFVYTFEATAL